MPFDWGKHPKARVYRLELLSLRLIPMGSLLPLAVQKLTAGERCVRSAAARCLQLVRRATRRLLLDAKASSDEVMRLFDRT